MVDFSLGLRSSDRCNETDVSKLDGVSIPARNLPNHRHGPEAPVRVVSPVPPADWLRCVGSSDVLPTQTPPWAACVSAAGGWKDRSRLYELADGRRLVVPLVGRAAVLASWPYGWGYGGALASDGRLSTSDVTTVVRDLAGLGALRVSLSPSPFEDVWQAALPFARARVEYLIQVLDLSGGLDGVWRGYSRNVKGSIRRAERSGLEVRRDDTGALLPVFTDLYRMSARRWAAASGRPAHLALLQLRITEPPRRLAAIASALGPALVVWGAFMDGQPVAALVVLRGHSTVLAWRGAMNRDLTARTQANTLLHHRAIEEAVLEGAACYSFGESDESSGVAEYKAKFGALPLRWSAYHLERLPLTATISAARATYTRAARLPAGVRARLLRRASPIS
ncbi:MAG: GNAT family N-acetyltransferase [Solirubrobacteraceae bacterium]